MPTNKNTQDTPGQVKKIRTAQGVLSQAVPTPLLRKARTATTALRKAVY